MLGAGEIITQKKTKKKELSYNELSSRGVGVK